MSGTFRHSNKTGKTRVFGTERRATGQVSIEPLKWYSFRWRFALVVFLLIAWASIYVGYRLYMAVTPYDMGTGPAGPAVARAPFEEIWSQEKVMLVGIGDSITNGLGAT